MALELLFLCWRFPETWYSKARLAAIRVGPKETVIPMKKLFVKALVLFACAFLAQSQIKAQNVASITGIVSDPSGAVVPGVNVTLQNPLTNVSYQAVTNPVGSYLILNVQPGPGYRISFSRDGFATATITDLYLNVNVTRTQNATLTVGGATQTVSVSAASEVVTLNTSDATVGNNFQVDFMQSLPVQNRDNPAALFTMQPGVTSSGSVTGARVDQTSVTVDGLDVNDMATGNFGAIVGHAPVDSVQEFRGTTAGMTSAASLGGGGHFDLVTKSGTNSFHGALAEYHRDTDTQANDWFNNNAGVPRSPLIRNQFGGEVGGPIKHNKAFFYFDWDSRRDTISNRVTRTVPTTLVKQGTLPYKNTSGTVEYLSGAQVASLDPSGKGFNAAVLSLFNSRYPTPNSTNAGNGYSTSGFRFNAPFPYVENVYVGRVDYQLTDKMNIFGRFTISHQDSTQSAIQFLGDPQTFPFLDRSRAWVVGHTWNIGANKTNNISWGQTVTDYSFPNSYNPQGAAQFTFGSTSSGGIILSQPYASAVNAQSRVYPIPVLRDEFAWIKGRHTLQIGGTFKYINPDFTTILNYNQPYIGMGGYLTSGLDATERPADIGSSYTTSYDAMFTTVLGHYASQNSTYNYDAKGNPFAQGSGLTHHYRYYEGDIYFTDSWKLTPNLTITYGLNWTSYSIPYDKNGIESTPSLDFTTFWNDRLAQSKAGKYGDTAVPLISYNLSGKANGQPGIYNPDRKNFGPHVAFAYSPTADRKSVFTGGVGLDYDRTVVSALLYQQSQFSYIFQAQNVAKYGSAAGPIPSLKGDARFTGIASPLAPPAAPPITKPYYPWANSTVCAPLGVSGPCGLLDGQAYNEAIDKNFKTPYSINVSAGFQHEFEKGFIWKINYAGRFGRRLMAQADANQLIDFPDTVSGQLMSAAVTNLEGQIRTGTQAGVNYSSVSGANKVTPLPWFENLVGNYFPGYFKSSTAEVTYFFNSLLNIGDFADTVEGLSNFAPSNVGMGAQFSEFTYYTNKGFSNYHGLLTTLHKNAGYGLQFDLNYTWSKSIDNVSVTANTVAFGGYGFVCDVSRPRECRAPSDFDNRNIISGNIIYELPFGHGRAFASTIPLWTDEIIGGWSLSALPYWRTGFPYFAYSNAFVAGYANDAPAVLTGSLNTMKSSVHKDSSGRVWIYKDPTAALNSFQGPTGFNIGSRNNLYGLHYTNFDLGLGKYFAIYKDRAKLQFRCDAFNAFNHPSFSTPGNDQRDITQTNAPFGQITGTDSTARVLQGSLRLEF